MAESKLKIYTNIDAIETIALFDTDFPNLHEIIKSHGELFVDISDEHLETMLSQPNDNNWLLPFYIGGNFSIHSSIEFFKSLKEDDSIVAKETRALYILDISEEEATKLTKDYGVMVLSNKSINDDIFQLDFKRIFQKQSSSNTDNNSGWTDIFDNVKLPPLNSLVITDNFLLKKDSQIYLFNLKQLLNCILPQSLSIPFHISIFSRMGENIKDAELFVGKLKSYLNTIRKYDFQVEIVYNETIHPRRIISNYFQIESDIGFNIFKSKEYKNIEVKEGSILQISSILTISNIKQGIVGDSILYITNIQLDQLKKISKELAEILKIPNKDIFKDPHKNIYGDVTKEKRIRNRLLK